MLCLVLRWNSKEEKMKSALAPKWSEGVFFEEIDGLFDCIMHALRAGN